MISKKVRIKDAYKGDAGRGRIRIDPHIIAELRLRTGDVIEIAHSAVEKKTAALLYPGKLDDSDTNIIRIDSSLRRNIGASLDDMVEIRKIECVNAENITFAGLKESVIIRRSEQLVRMLENRVITKEDILSFNAMGKRIDFIVIDYSPKTDSVRIHLDTKITISEKSYKELFDLKKRKITYEDIGGLRDEVQKLREVVELPLKHPELFKRMGIEPIKGILLYGLPGTGKTLLARAVAYESNAHFITVNGPETLSKFYGQSEKKLRKLFEEAKEMAPSIIYFDKFESIAPNRSEFSTSEMERKMIAQLLSLLDGLEERGDIIVLAETSKIKYIDYAFRRPGRFDREIELKSPDSDGRFEILKIHTRGVPLHDDVDLKEIAERTEGFVGADLKMLVKEAALIPIREVTQLIDDNKAVPQEILSTLQVKMKNFLSAIENVKPSSTLI